MLRRAGRRRCGRTHSRRRLYYARPDPEPPLPPAATLPPIRALLEGAVDYAGLFPPAQLDLPHAVAAYAEYVAGPDRWALGRFVLPAARLGEFEAAAEPLLPRAPDAGEPWRLALLAGAALEEALRAAGELNCRHAADGAGRMTADVVETTAATPAAIRALGAVVPRWMTAYVEVPIDGDPAAIVGAIAESGLRAKIRTGGIAADAFPPAPALARFLRACVEAAVPFKATAGLHHPLRATYRLTYAPGSASGTMYGYLNVMLATALIAAGATDADAVEILEEPDPAAFRFDPDGVSWHALRVGTADLARTRAERMISFGSCSFREPVDDLRGLGLL